MILCLISFRFSIKILVGIKLQQKIQNQVLKLARVDSRARASRSHQDRIKYLREVYLMDQGLDQVKMEKKIFKKTWVKFCKF